MTRRVLRTVIPVDDQWHTHDLTGPIVHIATRHHDRVELWFVDDSDLSTRTFAYRAFATGQPLAEPAGRHVGTAISPDGALAWHLFQLG